MYCQNNSTFYIKSQVIAWYILVPMKNFDLWNNCKKRIDAAVQYRHPKEKEIWWCMLGVNIGVEIYGKGELFMRPVLVINADGGQNCVVVPLTSKVRKRKYSCTIKTDDGMLHSALVFQMRSIDKRRLVEKKYRLSDEEHLRVKKVFDSIYNIQQPPFGGCLALAGRRGNPSRFLS